MSNRAPVVPLVRQPRPRPPRFDPDIVDVAWCLLDVAGFTPGRVAGMKHLSRYAPAMRALCSARGAPS
jgi:hypothetical protein